MGSERRFAVIQLGFATPHLLHAVIGIVTSCLLYRGSLLCIFCDVCRVLHEHQHGPLRVTREQFARSCSGLQLRWCCPYLSRIAEWRRHGVVCG